MSKTNVNILSALLVFVFILSCFTFFGVSAEDVEETTEPTTEIVETTTTEVVTTTTIATTTTTKVTTNAATVADPVYTSKTSKTPLKTLKKFLMPQRLLMTSYLLNEKMLRINGLRI